MEFDDEEIVFFTGLERALIGFVTTFEKGGHIRRAVYSQKKVIQILMEDGVTEEGAQEFFDFNIAGSYVGENTPAFFTSVDDLDDPSGLPG